METETTGTEQGAAATGTPRIDGAVIEGGRIYKAGDEAALARAMEGKSLDRLLEKKAISGNWSGGNAGASAPTPSAETATEGSATTAAASEPAAPAQPVKAAAKKSARKRAAKKVK